MGEPGTLAEEIRELTNLVFEVAEQRIPKEIATPELIAAEASLLMWEEFWEPLLTGRPAGT